MKPNETINRFSGANDLSVQPVDLGDWEPLGFKSAARDYACRGIDLNRLLMPNKAASFLARADGDGLLAHGIFDGDLLIIDRSLTPRRGDLIGVYFEGSFRIIPYSDARPEMTLWGVVSHCIHPYSNRPQQ